MATIEITWTMGVAITGWTVTAIGLIKVYWRKSLEWDHAEKHHKLLLGDPETLDFGLVRRVHTLESSQVTDDRIKKIEAKGESDGKLLTVIAKALNAYGPDEAAIVKAIEDRIHHLSVPPKLFAGASEQLEEDPFPPSPLKNPRKR